MSPRDFGDLNKLVQFAREHAVSIAIEYSEIDNQMSLTVSSAAPAECYHEKRALGVDDFIRHWHEHLRAALRAGSNIEGGT